MEHQKAFPIAIIDEDYEGKHAAGRGMRQLAAAIEKEGFRVVGGVSYEDARRLVHVFNSESCWLVSVDGVEDDETRWEVLEEVLAAKRSATTGCRSSCSATTRTAEMVPASVLKHANAFMRLFEDSPEFMARAIARAAQLYLERLAAADVQGADGLHAAGQLLLAHARATAAASASARARSDSSSTSSSARTRCAPTSRCRSASSARCSTIPGRSPRASATRRASSAPTRRCSSSVARRPPTRSSGTAWSAAATSCCATAIATSRSCTR